MVAGWNEFNQKYMETKAEKMGHEYGATSSGVSDKG